MKDKNTLKVPWRSLSDHKDIRIVCGANCVWWDSIDKASKAMPIPTCPRCGHVLFEFPDIEKWWEMVDTYEAGGHPGYRVMIEWMRGKCFKSIKDAKAAYEMDQASRFVSNQIEK